MLKARRQGSPEYLDPQHVRDIYELYGDGADLQADRRPRKELIWKDLYAASLFASGTHYIIFDHVEQKGRALVGTRLRCPPPPIPRSLPPLDPPGPRPAGAALHLRAC